MLPLHCGRCGRLIGKAEKRDFEGQTVCVRCFSKLGGDQVIVTPKQTVTYIVVAAAVTALFLGAAIWAMTKFVEMF